MNAPRTLPAGYALHEYRIESVLGAGGFGVTYLAKDGNLDTRVALKEYFPDDLALRGESGAVAPKSRETEASFQQGLKRFMEEARTLASFRHSNIVRVLRFFEGNATGYMVMEFVEGRSLHEWIRSYRPLTRDAVLSLTHQLLDGLELIHRNGYLHRDIKPTNIFVREDGAPVLIDFGSARRLSGGTSELTVMVSAGFAPLEQYHAHGKQGPWTDLYALGGVLYWLVTGQRPVEAAARVRQDTLVSAEKIGDTQRYGIDLLRAIDWALRPNEEERPQSVAALRKALGESSDDPSPTLELTGGVPPIGGDRPSAGLTGVALDHNEVRQIETELAQHMGPIAGVMVRQAAKKATSVEALVSALAAEIDDEKKRAKFVKSLSNVTTGRPTTTSAVSTSSVSAKFSADQLNVAETRLAQYIGAVARVIVKRAAAKARDETELYLLIAEEIESPSERQAFVRKAMSVASGKR